MLRRHLAQLPLLPVPWRKGAFPWLICSRRRPMKRLCRRQMQPRHLLLLYRRPRPQRLPLPR
jgi:hypothetical protein